MNSPSESLAYGSFSEQAADVVDQLWPALLVVGVMMLMQWAVTLYFGAEKAQRYILPAYFMLAALGAAHNLHEEGHIYKAYEAFTGFDDQSKYLFTVIAVALSYGLSVISPRPWAAKSNTDSVIASWRGMAVDSAPMVTYPRELPKGRKESFIKIHEMLSQELLDDIAQNHEGIPEQLAWVEEMLEYNTVGGKMNRGMGVVDVLRAFAAVNEKELTHEEVCRGSVLGWAIEWLQAFFLVADDVMDKSLTRRGQPCWYKVPKVQEIAINDSFILEAHVYKMLKRHFEHEDYYIQLMELFHDVAYRTEMGQLLDLTSQPMSGPMDLSRFTLERYRMIVRYKTAFYTFYCPCAIGMIYAGVKDPESYQLARDICCRIGEFFQIQDDYLDCYGHPDVIGKVGTDIQDTKCSWLVVQALERATPKQRKLLEDNYGVDDEKKIERVKELYRELELEKLYKEYEEKTHAEIKELIAKVENIPHAVFHQFIDKIYKRSK